MTSLPVSDSTQAPSLIDPVPVTKPNTFDMHEFLARPRFINRSVFMDTALYGTPLLNFSVFQQLILSPLVAPMLTRIQALRARLHVRIEFNGTPYVYGRLMATWRHTGGCTGDFTNANEQPILTMSQRSTMYHTKIDPSARSAVEMTLPFYHMAGMYAKDDATPPDNFEVCVLDTLKYNGSGTVVPPTFTITAWMSEVELLIPHLQSELSGAISRIAPGSSRSVRGFASTFARGVADVALTAVGLGSPQLPFIPEHSTDVATVRTQSDQPQLAVSNAGHRLVENPITPTDPESDPLSFSSIASREAFVSRVQWSDGAVPTMLAAFAVAPSRVCQNVAYTSSTGPNVTGICLTPAGALATCFRYWRGTMRIRVEIVANKFCRGKLRLRYVPRTAFSSLTYVNDVGDLLTQMVDISDNTEMTMDIPWSATTPWLKVRTSAGDSSYKTTECNGFIVLEATEGLNSSGAGSVSVLVYTSFPELRLAVPQPVYDGLNVSVGSGTLVLQSEQQIDEYFNLRDLLKCIEPTAVYHLPGSQENVSLIRLPAKPWLRGQSNTSTRTYTHFDLGLEDANVRLSRFAFLSACFLSYTGNIRITMTDLISHSLGPSSTKAMISRLVRGTYTRVPIAFPLTFENYAIHLIRSGSIEGEIREIKPTAAAGHDNVSQTSMVVDCPAGENSCECLVKYPLGQDFVNDYPFLEFIIPESDVRVMFSQSAGDDYALHHFQYVPILFFD